MAIETEFLEGPQRRVSPLLLVLLGIILVVGAAFLLLTFVFNGGEEAEEFVAPIEPAPSEPVAPKPKAEKKPEETVEVFEGKDPFDPLVSITSGGPAGPGATPAPGGTPTPGPAATSGAGGAPAPSGGTRVALVDVFTRGGKRLVQVRVGSTLFTVGEGEVFAGNFKVISLEGECGTFLHGDDKFTLCEGEEVIK